MSHSLLPGRILRITGMSLIVSFLLASSLLYTLSFSNTAIPWFGLSVVIVMIGGGILMGLGFVLLWVGERISPPDPWLDSWITPWRSYKESKTRRELIRAEEDAIRATVVTDKNWGQHLEIKGECFVEFEGGTCILGSRERIWNLSSRRKSCGRMIPLFKLIPDVGTMEK
jgi:hypothetical protein